MANDVVLNNRQAKSVATAEGGQAVMIGGVFTAIGVVSSLVGLGVIATQAAPKLVLGLIGINMLAIGVSFAIHGLRGLRVRKRANIAQVERPGMPWTWDYAWDPRGRIDENLRTAMRSTATGILMLLFLAPFNIIAFTLKDVPKLVLGVAIVFDLLFAVPLVVGIYQWLQVARNGRVRARFGSFPFQLGSALNLDLQMPGWTRELPTLKATLRCLEERMIATDHGDRSVSTQVFQVYVAELPLTLSQGPEGTATASIRFDLPAGDYATRLSNVPPRYWELELSAKRPGIDYNAKILLPIY